MNNKGFIQLIVIAVMLIIILSLLGVSLSALFSNKTLRDNFKFVWDSAVYIWNQYLVGPAEFVWRIWVDYVWKSFTAAIERIKEGNNPVSPEESLP